MHRLVGLLLCGALPQAAAPAPVPLPEAIRNHGVRVELRGAGMGSAEATLRAARAPVWVVIPAGTRFSGGPELQTMVSLRPITVRVRRGSPATVMVPAVCTNISLTVPMRRDRLRALPPAAGEIQTLLATAARTRLPDLVTQAAVWVLTNDADFDQLGVVRTAAGRRVIRAQEAARAMMLIERAKLDLKRRALWKERRNVAAAVLKSTPRRQAPVLYDWCARQLRTAPPAARVPGTLPI